MADNSENIRELSKSANVRANYTPNNETGGRTFPNLFEAVTAGCLQRIADSLEKLEVPYEALKSKITMQERQLSEQRNTILALTNNSEEYKLRKQVSKLSARLKKAGLDWDPNSDRRGKKVIRKG